MTRAVMGIVLAAATWTASLSAANYVPSGVRPPAPAREFRGVWVASVNNIDWPSKPGLSTAHQKAELVAILERAAQLKLNAIILQVRPACDALYASKLEPWSEYLSGTMGRAPKPFYDPLAFAVQEAHQRGLELHAWFNPFRARHSTGKSAMASSHISRIRPDLVKTYGTHLWLDPGENAAIDHSLAVILDVVRRYEINGVHLDDYFYPYPERNAHGLAMDFPDSASWQRYLVHGGKLDRAEWRRQNVDHFIHRLYQAIKAEKPWVKLGLSPFGIWRPGTPAQIKGFDAYDTLYADSRKWLVEGWLDYCAPQLYWAIGEKEQSFPVLLKWWTEQNAQQRHLWPGLSCYRHGPEEIVNQIRATRKQAGGTGNILWSAKVLTQTRTGLADRLLKEVYAQPGLPPASTWLDNTPPAQPRVFVTDGPAVTLKMTWEPTGPEPAWLWLLQTKSGGEWQTEIMPGRGRGCQISRQPRPDVVAVSAVDRCGNVGLPRVLEKQRIKAP